MPKDTTPLISNPTVERLHDNCAGEVSPITGHEGCYDDNYGCCTKCGLEGELIVEATDEGKGLVFVSIRPTISRHEQ